MSYRYFAACLFLFVAMPVAWGHEGWELSRHGLAYYGPDGAFVRLGTDTEAGVWHDDGVYASFGLEHQNFHFSKLVFPLQGGSGVNTWGHRWIFHVDFAPIYDSIRREDKGDETYGQDSQGRDINGKNVYFDWYKNLGSRVYFLGDVPIVEAYGGYVMGRHTLRAGRMKNLVGLYDHQVFWGDDAKFAPMQYWLSRDLLSGVTYTYHHDVIGCAVGVFSGNHPMKGYAHYLGGIQSPQCKGNNTPTLSARLSLYGQRWLPSSMESEVFVSIQDNKVSSTWVDGLGDGKRHGQVMALGGVWTWHVDSSAWVHKVQVLGQYTRYVSGLDPKSAQNNGHPRFRTLRQGGFFVGGGLGLWQSLDVCAAYEMFDRFDYLVYEKSGFGQSMLLAPGTKQKSTIVNITYAINDVVSLCGAYHVIKNPVPFVSDVLDTKGDNRYKITIAVKT
ncbi:hypothetical protein EIL50_02205 [bacterium NHP-B]|nr:hypothetical protein EIL50_02205 [bacterium NHP-B]